MLFLLALLALCYLVLFIYLQSNKKTILQKTIATLSNSLHAPVHVADMEISLFRYFPSISLQLKDVRLGDTITQQGLPHIFYAKDAFITMNPYALLLGRTSLGRISLNDGALNLFTDSTGRSNLDRLQQKKKQEEKATSFPLKRLQLNRFAFNSVNEQKGKEFRIFIHQLHAVFKDNTDSISIQLKQQLTVNALTFNPVKGSYVKGQQIRSQLKLAYIKQNRELKLLSAPWQIGTTDFNIAAQFVFGATPTFDLQLATQKVYYDTIGRLVTPGIATALKHAQLGGALSCNARIAGPLNEGEPLINISWISSPGILRTPVLNFDSASFKGSFVNQLNPQLPREDPNSQIVLSSFKGKLAGLALRSDSIVLTNLKNPQLRLRFLSDFRLADLNEEIASDLVAFEKGSGQLDLSFNGPVTGIDSSNTKLYGSLRFNNGVLRFLPLNIAMTNCKADIKFDHADIIITELSCLSTYHKPLFLQGEARNIIAAFNKLPEKMLLNLRMKGPYINTEGISALLETNDVKKKKKGTFLSSAVKIDELLNKGTVNVLLETDKLQHERFEATRVKLQAALRANSWSLNKMEMQHSGGAIIATASVKQNGSGKFLLQTNAAVQNINARKLFYSFNDFGQTGISHKHIDGNLTFSAKLTMPINRKGGFETTGANGVVDFLFSNGRLQNFKPLEKLKTFVFKNRNFSDVRFADIRDKINIEKGIVSISRINIESSVLSLYVSGQYDLNGRSTDMSLQVPLRNVSRRDSSYMLAKPATSGGGGMSIFLRAKSQEDGNITLRYDPLGRFRKRN